MEKNIRRECEECAFYEDCYHDYNYDKCNSFVLDRDIDDYIREDEENKEENNE